MRSLDYARKLAALGMTDVSGRLAVLKIASRLPETRPNGYLFSSSEVPRTGMMASVGMTWGVASSRCLPFGKLGAGSERAEGVGMTGGAHHLQHGAVLACTARPLYFNVMVRLRRNPPVPTDPTPVQGEIVAPPGRRGWRTPGLDASP